MDERVGSNGTKTAIEFLTEDISEIRKSIDSIDQRLALLPALEVRLGAVETIVRGAVAIVLTGVAMAIIKNVILVE